MTETTSYSRPERVRSLCDLLDCAVTLAVDLEEAAIAQRLRQLSAAALVGTVRPDAPERRPAH